MTKRTSRTRLLVLHMIQKPEMYCQMCLWTSLQLKPGNPLRQLIAKKTMQRISSRYRRMHCKGKCCEFKDRESLSPPRHRCRDCD